MKEKSRQKEKTPTTGGSGSIFGAASGLPANPTATVSSGPYVEELPVAGMTVGEVRRKFSDRLDIGDEAAAILNGHPVRDDVVIKSQENLMFIMHAGEKGSVVTIKGKTASTDTFAMDLDQLLPRVGPAISTGEVVLPSGIRSVLSNGPITIWVWEKPPHIARLSWITPDSPEPYGPEAKYRDVRIALPYLIIMAVFARDNKGLPILLCKDECFFRNEPLSSMGDTLHYPGLLNCSCYPVNSWGSTLPLAWICTQYLKKTKQMASNDPGDRFRAGFEAVRYCLLETSFNLSSEHHEGNSWYGKNKHIDPRLKTVAAWEEATQKDPLFALDVPWISTEHTLRQVAQRMFRIYGGGNGEVHTADDLARIITNG